MTPDQTDEYRRSANRRRSVIAASRENLDLFTRMKAGEFADGSRPSRQDHRGCTQHLAARSLLYRIKHTDHHQTGGKWCIYPMATRALPERLHRRHYAQHLHAGVGSASPALRLILENLTHHARWEAIRVRRLSLGYTIMSKRKLMQLVDENLVTGWDDPRMPTISGIRRRGVRPAPCATLPTTSASRNTMASPMSACWSLPSAKIEQTRPAPPCRVAPDQSRPDELSRGQSRGTGSFPIIPRTKPPANAKSRSAANSTSSATTSPKCRRRNSSV